MYNSRITREHRTAFILLCDRSGSMSEEIELHGERTTKAKAVAGIINSFIDELINRCRHSDGVRDYFDIAVLEYSGDGVTSLLSSDIDFTSVSDLIKRPIRISNETILRTLPTGNQVTASVVKRHWIEPKASGSTPMGTALFRAEKMLRAWCNRTANRLSFPPVVINITDGEASDADAQQLCEIADRLRTASTEDGDTMLFNIHLAQSQSSSTSQVSFPSCIEDIPPHRYARVLYDMSSIIPECYNAAVMERRPGTPPFRAMSFNCAMEELFHMLEIGSLSVSLIA